jgi:hypothetical protein
LAFTPVDPIGISTLKGIYVSNPQLLAPDARSIAFVFGDETIGTFAVEEWISQETQADLKAQLQYNTDPSNTEKLSLVTLKGGELALLAVGPNTTYVQEIRGTLLVQVIGPSTSFTAVEAIAIADQVS